MMQVVNRRAGSAGITGMVGLLVISPSFQRFQAHTLLVLKLITVGESVVKSAIFSSLTFLAEIC